MESGEWSQVSVVGRGGLGQDCVDDLSTYVGEAVVAAGVAVGEAFVVKAQQVQQRGVEVGHGHLVLLHVVPEVVGLTVRGPAPHASPRQPDAERVRMMVATIAPLSGWSPAKLGAEDHQR